MIRLLFTILAAALFAFPAQATKKNPGYARDKAVEMRSGDWYLLCDNQNNCAIRGIVKKLKRPALSRALVMIDRRAGQGNRWFVRLVFLDDAGRDESKGPPPEKLRLYNLGRRSNLPPAPVDLEMQGGNPVHYVTQARTPSFLSALMRNRPAIIREQSIDFASMPRGNLRKLLDRAEREQRTHVPQVDPDETDTQIPRFDYDIYAAEQLPDAIPAGLKEPCKKGDARRSRQWRLLGKAKLWLVDCRTEVKIYRQLYGKAAERLHLNDLDGNRYEPRDADFDADTGLLSMIVREKGRADCGYQISWGWTADWEFALITSTKMPLCRNIPANYWPTIWEALRWRVIGSLIDHGGREFRERVPAANGDYAPEPE